MHNFVMPESIAKDTVGGTIISTVKLNSAGWGYETCMFYANGDSDVVAVNATAKEALTTHLHIVLHEQQHLDVANKQHT